MKAAILFMFVMFASSYSCAETVILKNGDEFNANVIQKDEKSIVLDYKGSALAYYPFEIESIGGKPVKPEEGRLQDKADIKAREQTIKVRAVKAEEYVKRADVFRSKATFDLAMKNASNALAIQPGYAQAYVSRGLIYAAQNQPLEAIADYTKAIGLNAKYEEAYYLRGLVHAAIGKRDEAIADYTKAIELSPKYIQAYLNRGVSYANKGNAEEAISDMSRAIKINPNVPEAYYLRAVVYTNKGNFDQAIADYTKAIELNGNHIQSYLNRALVYAYKAKFNQNEDPNSPRAFINIGATYKNKDLYLKAVSDCNKAIEIDPDLADAYITRARVYMMMQDYKSAWDGIKKVESMGYKIEPGLMAELRRLSGKND